MSEKREPGVNGVLGSVRQLEGALEATSTTRAASEARLGEARSEASRLLAAARDATAAAVAERRRVVLAAAEDDAAEISPPGRRERGPRASRTHRSAAPQSSRLRWRSSCRPTQERGVSEVLVAMTKVQIVGRKHHVEPVLGRLYQMGLLELVSAREEPALELAPFPGEDERAERIQEQNLLLAQLDGLLTLAGDSAATAPAVEAASSDDVRRELNTIVPLVEPLAARIEDLQTELAVLPRYIEPLSRLLPLVPELAELDESEIHALQLDAVALVLNTADETVVDVCARLSGQSSAIASCLWRRGSTPTRSVA